MVKTYAKLTEIAENHGFGVKIDRKAKDKYILLEQFTPLGEDWCIEFNFCSLSDLIKQLLIYSYYFDAEEEAEPYIDMRGKHGIPSSIRALLDDAEWKDETLEKFVKSVA